MNIKDTSILCSMATVASENQTHFKPFELVNMVWACAKLNVYSYEVVTKFFINVAKQVISDVKEFSYQSLSMITWAFATTGLEYNELFDAVRCDNFFFYLYKCKVANCM